MANAPFPSKTRVNKAGERLRKFILSEIELTDEELGEEVNIVLHWREQHASPIALTMPGLRNWVGRYSSLGIRPTQRLKRLPRIVEKLRRHEGMKLARVQDIGGARAILANRSEVERVRARIQKKWTVDRIVDWREDGRPDTGYRALHVMVVKRDSLSQQDRVVEVQLRTANQQRWAEVVSETEDRLGYPLRDGDGPAELVDYFRSASELLAAQDEELILPPGFADRFETLREQVRPFFAPK